MKAGILIFLGLAGNYIYAQQPAITQRQEQQLEQFAEREETIPEDESLAQQLEAFQKRPVNLNTAKADELAQLPLLTALQITSLLQYRLLLGKIIDVYELQAIPYWDISSIQKLLPYITINDPLPLADQLFARMKGESHLVFRVSQSFNSPMQADTGATGNLGSPQKLLVRYRYNYKNLLQFGILGEKDAGEPLFKNQHPKGFDFYSLHLFIRNAGIIQSLAIGDFTVNLGQGLIQWQSLAFGKSAEVTNIKRQSGVLRPYSSAGEYNFQRGIGITLARKQIQFTAFASLRKLDANLSIDAAGNTSISSFLITGMHRSAAEIEEKNNVSRQTIGANFSYRSSRWHAGVNYILHHFNYPVIKKEEPYNFYSGRGDRLINYSFDYDYTLRNIHFFGEVAAGPAAANALLNGLLVSLDKNADAVIVYRRIAPGFQSLNASAFTENSVPANESGLFIGLLLRPFSGIRLDAYADVFRFPWLKFRVDGPSVGREYLLQLTYQPARKLEVTGRFRYQMKYINYGMSTEPANQLVPVPKTNWRININWQLSREVRLRQRVEMVWYGQASGQEQGYLIYNDVNWQPAGKRVTVGGRVQIFETDGFNSRIYAFENDPSSYSVGSIYHKGLRYYLNLKLRPGRLAYHGNSRLFIPSDISFRWAQTFYARLDGIESQPSIQSECKLQVIFLLY